MSRRASLIVAGLLAMTAVTPRVWAAGEERPFVEHRLVLQLSDAAPEKQSLVLSIAFNVLKAYGPDRVAVEVVAFGPGIALLRQDSPNRHLVESLMAQDVVFDVCMNSVETAERNAGEPYPVHPN